MCQGYLHPVSAAICTLCPSSFYFSTILLYPPSTAPTVHRAHLPVPTVPLDPTVPTAPSTAPTAPLRYPPHPSTVPTVPLHRTHRTPGTVPPYPKHRTPVPPPPYPRTTYLLRAYVLNLDKYIYMEGWTSRPWGLFYFEETTRLLIHSHIDGILRKDDPQVTIVVSILSHPVIHDDWMIWVCPTHQDTKVPAIGLAVDDTFCSPGGRGARAVACWVTWTSTWPDNTSCDRTGNIWKHAKTTWHATNVFDHVCFRSRRVAMYQQ